MEHKRVSELNLKVAVFSIGKVRQRQQKQGRRQQGQRWQVSAMVQQP